MKKDILSIDKLTCLLYACKFGRLVFIKMLVNNFQISFNNLEDDTNSFFYYAC